MHKIKWFIPWIMFFVSTLNAQETFWRSFGSNEGLPFISASNCVQDSENNLWMASNEGLIRFDGQTFKLFSMQDGLPANFVTHIAIHPLDQSVWVTTIHGIAKKEGNSFVKVEVNDQNPLMGYRQVAFGHEGRIFVGGNAGVICLANGQIERINKGVGLSNNVVKTILPVSADSVFVGTAKGLNLISSSNESTLIEATAQFNVRKIIRNRSGELYILDGLGTVRKRKNDNWPIVFESKFIGDIYFSTKQQLYISQMTSISVLESDSLLFELDQLPGEQDEALNFSFLDNENQLWVFNSSQLFQSTISDISFLSVCPDETIDFCQFPISNIQMSHDGQIWVSTEDGVGLLKDNMIQSPFLNYSSFKGGMSGIAMDNHQNLWMSFQIGGIMKWDFKSSTEYFSNGSLTDIQFYDIFRRKNGSIWAGRNGGYVKIIKEEFSPVQIPHLDRMDISSFAEDIFEHMWIASSHGGVYQIQNDSIHSSYFENIPVSKIVISENHLWAVTKGMGLIQAKTDDSGTLSNVVWHNKGSDFPYTIIQDIAIDPNGLLWVLTFNELVRFDPKNDQFISFTHEDQLKPYTYSFHGLFIDTTNTLWIACDAGLQKINLNTFTPDTNQVKISLDEVRIGNSPTIKTEFKPNENFLTFTFNGVYLRNPKRVKFRTKLEGLQDEWTNWSTEDHINYSSLPSGKYTFLAQASNGNGIITDAESYSFSIATPLFKNPLFLFFLATALGIIGLFLYRMRIKNLRKQSNRQNEINKQLARLEIEALRSKMNPHFIFNSLSSIQHLILEKNEHGALEYLNKFGKLIRQVLEKSSDSKIKILDEIAMLRNYIDLESLRFDAPFEYFISISPELAEVNPEIPYLLVQPFVENAIHHGLIPRNKDGMLTILAATEGDLIKFTIEDNGIGRAASAKANQMNLTKRKSKGIEVTQNRLKLIHENLKTEFVKIIDLFDEKTKKAIGTRIEIEIPL